MTDRLYIASEVTRRLNYIRHDTLELSRLLRGETLSRGFHDSLTSIIRDLQRIADEAEPRGEATPRRADETAPRVLERIDAA